MPGKSEQWKSCPRGHNYLGDECPCRQANRYAPRVQQAPPREERTEPQVRHREHAAPEVAEGE